ncbi:hypothetical protein VTK26DRAFT_3749 [Humicola hyalothermophila]
MRRISRLRAPVPAGFCPSPVVTGAPLRAPCTSAPAAVARQKTISTSAPTWQTRTLSTTTSRASSSSTTPSQAAQPPADEIQEIEDFEDYYAAAPPATNLVYPHGITDAPAPTDVTDASYKPAETAEGLAEVGGLAGWWDEPAHWGSPEGPAGAVRACLQTFGGASNVDNGAAAADKNVLEAVVRRAVVEALVVKRFMKKEVGKVGAVDEVFESTLEMGGERLAKILRAKVVPGEDGQATLGDFRDWQRVWDLLRSAVKAKRAEAKKQPAAQKANGEKVKEGEAVAEEANAEEAATPAEPTLTPEMAKEMIQSWDKGWRKAELRDPVVKFYIAKRIQQLTGRRIPDGKLCAIRSVDSLLKELVEPPKPKKLAELIEAKGVFKDLPNVRVFPRRVTPIDKEKMVGRWKIIVDELKKRELPVTGTGDYGEAVEKKWIEGRA